MVSMPTIQPLAALLQQTGQVQEILELARQKVEIATNPSAFGNGVPIFDNFTEALSAVGMATAIAAAATAVGGYFLYLWTKNRRAMLKTVSTA